jgi:hypothetical protein
MIQKWQQIPLKRYTKPRANTRANLAYGDILRVLTSGIIVGPFVAHDGGNS